MDKRSGNPPTIIKTNNNTAADATKRQATTRIDSGSSPSTNATQAETESTINSYWQGVKDCIPTLLGYVSIGFAFGIVGIASGLSMIEVALLSFLVYGGASQFIFCALIVAGSPAIAIIFTTFMVNLRHFLLSLTLAPHFSQYSLGRNVGLGILVTDESFGVAANKLARKEKLGDKWMNGLNTAAYVCWGLSCILGAMAGQWVRDPEPLGLDFALTAMFAALLVLQVQQGVPRKIRTSLTLITCTIVAMVVLSFFMPTYIAVLLSTVLVSALGVVIDR